MNNQQKALLVISILLAISLAGNYYFYSSTNVSIDESLIRSQERLKQYEATIDTLEAKNAELVASSDTIDGRIDTVETQITNTVIKYEIEKHNIVNLSSGSAVQFLSGRLNRADSLRD